jgi:hypothetical protein
MKLQVNETKVQLNKSSKIGSRAITLFLVGFVGIVLTLSYTLNSQALPRYDGLSYQVLYLNLSRYISENSNGAFIRDFLNGRYFYNNFLPLLAFVNARFGLVFPSWIAVGFSNILILFGAVFFSARLFSRLVLKRQSASLTAAFFLSMISQDIFWTLGNGWLDLRNDMPPLFVLLMTYLSATLYLLETDGSLSLAGIYLVGLIYLVLARAALVPVLGICIFLGLVLILVRDLQPKKLLWRRTVHLLLLSCLPILSMIPRLPMLRVYYVNLAFDVGQWHLMRQFWLNDAPRIFGKLPFLYWSATAAGAVYLAIRNSRSSRPEGDDLGPLESVIILGIPAFVVFFILTYQGTFGNPFGYILPISSGIIGLALIPKDKKILFPAILLLMILLVFQICRSIKEIEPRLTADKIATKQLQLTWNRLPAVTKDQPFEMVFFTPIYLDCISLRVMSLERNLFADAPATCKNFFHAVDFGLNPTTIGRGDLLQLRKNIRNYKALPTSIISNIVEGKGTPPPSSNHSTIYFWTLKDSHPDMANANSYIYSHRAMDIIKNELEEMGARSILTDSVLNLEIYELHSP